MSTEPLDLSGLPDHWSMSAKTTYATIDAENPRATASQQTALFEAVSLIALADELAGTIPITGLMTTGSQGQAVVNPAIAEVRALRSAALAALRGIGFASAASAHSAASAAGAALISHRWAAR